MKTLFISISALIFLSACGGGGGDGEDTSEPASEVLEVSRTLRIMPLGDSITEAEGGRASYRFWLWQALQVEGLDVDFVGTQRGVHQGSPRFSDFDQDHEGYWDYNTERVLARAPVIAAAGNPDIVLLHLGTNDIRRAQSAEGTINEIALIIDSLRQVNPQVTVLLAQIIPTNVNGDKIPFFNSLIPGFAQIMSTSESLVRVVDQNTGFSLSRDSYDGVHPNESGEIKMATAWLNAILEVIP